MSPIAPILTQCPNGTVYLNLTRSVSADSSAGVNTTEMDFPMAMHPRNRSVTLSSSVISSRAFPASANSRLAMQMITIQTTAGDSNLLISVSGDLVGVTSIVLQVSLVATDDLMVQSGACNFTIDITIQTPSNCTVGESQASEIAPAIEQVLQVTYGVTMILGIPLANVS